MPRSEGNFRVLMKRVAAGAAGAVAELLQLYQHDLIHAIRMKLHRKLRPKFDSLDFAQDVWASFFADMPQGPSFDRPDELVAFLTRVAQHKVMDAFRQRMKGEKYNVNREQSLDDSQEMKKEDLVAQDPSPSEVIMSQEEWDRFLQGQPLVYQHILIRLREGQHPAKIALEMGLHERTVRRVGSKVMMGLTG
jgi:DNA-directed RNA polymerase specialized sigma24 family protein